MKSMMIAGLLLVAIGMVSLIYEGITYTKQKDVVNMGPIKITANEEKTIPISPIIGALMLVGGVALFLASRKNA
jgi:hypothetical protein